MTFEGILGIVIFIVVILLVMFGMRLYWKMRADNGYNMGRNYMHDLGFTDDDINRGQDDPDKDMYVFRKTADHNKKEKN